jgi:hypothetical protein
MAVVQPTKTLILPNDGLGDSTADGWQVVWSGLNGGDTGAPVQFPGYADRSFQVVIAGGGSYTSGAISCLGSNDLATFAILSQPNSTPASLSGAGIIAVTEATIQVQPSLSGVVATNLNVAMFFRKTQQNMK